MENKSELCRDMFQLIEEWKASGKSKKQFCQEHQISHNRFFYWQKRYREQNNPAHRKRFIQVKTAKKPETPVIITGKIEIHYPNGVNLHLPAGTGMSVIKGMIHLFERQIDLK